MTQMPIKIEKRDDGRVRLSGYVCAVGRDSRLLPPTKTEGREKKFYEVVEPGAFTTALNKNQNVILKLNHKDIITSQSENSTFLLNEDNIGLYVDLETDNPQIYENVDKLQGWSFGFNNAKDRWTVADDGNDRRILQGFDLVEISALTTTPAYIGTSIEVRDYDLEVEEVKTEEDASSTSDGADRYNYYRARAQYLKLCRR